MSHELARICLRMNRKSFTKYNFRCCELREGPLKITAVMYATPDHSTKWYSACQYISCLWPFAIELFYLFFICFSTLSDGVCHSALATDVCAQLLSVFIKCLPYILIFVVISLVFVVFLKCMSLTFKPFCFLIYTLWHHYTCWYSVECTTLMIL